MRILAADDEPEMTAALEALPAAGRNGIAATEVSRQQGAELKQMYYKGEITRREYREETGEELE